MTRKLRQEDGPFDWNELLLQFQGVFLGRRLSVEPARTSVTEDNISPFLPLALMK